MASRRKSSTPCMIRVTDMTDQDDSDEMEVPVGSAVESSSTELSNWSLDKDAIGSVGEARAPDQAKSTGDPQPQRKQQGGYECKYCPFSTQNLNEFKEHVDSSHPNVILNPLYLCAVCNFNTKKFDTLTEHNEKCHPGESNFKFKRIKVNSQTILEQTIEVANNSLPSATPEIGEEFATFPLSRPVTEKIGKLKTENKRFFRKGEDLENKLDGIPLEPPKKQITALNVNGTVIIPEATLKDGLSHITPSLQRPPNFSLVPKIAVPLNTTKYNPSLDGNMTLITSFNKFPYPTQAELSWLTAASKHPEEQIKVWFTTQRLKQGISWSPEEVEEARKKMFNGTIQPVQQTFTVVPAQLTQPPKAAQPLIQTVPCQLLGQSSIVLTPVANGPTVTCAPIALTVANQVVQTFKRPLPASVAAPEAKRPTIIQSVLAPPKPPSPTGNFTPDQKKTRDQITVLKASFAQSQFPDDKEVYRLIESTGLSRGEIKKWFSDQRSHNQRGPLHLNNDASTKDVPQKSVPTQFPLLERVKGKTSEQLKMLEESFQKTSFPTQAEVDNLANDTRLSKKEIDSWFSERRALRDNLEQALLNSMGSKKVEVEEQKQQLQRGARNGMHEQEAHPKSSPIAIVAPCPSPINGKTLGLLRDVFTKTQWPSPEEYSQLESQTGLSRTDIVRWFKDSRSALKSGTLDWIEQFQKLGGQCRMEQALLPSSESILQKCFQEGKMLRGEDVKRTSERSKISSQEMTDWFPSKLGQGTDISGVQHRQAREVQENWVAVTMGVDGSTDLREKVYSQFNMQTTDIGAKEEGRIWHRKPTPAPSSGVIRSLPGHRSKTVRFLHVAFDVTGESFLAGDHHGNIYVFDIARNRFKLVQKTGQACTALAFSLRRTTEYLVALADYSIKCFDKDTKQLVSWMRGHDGAVSSISVHSSGRYAITTSADTAQLWDLDTFQRKRKLSVRWAVGIQKVFFLPLSNSILSCFSDDSIFAWESDTLKCKYQLPVPEEGSSLRYRAFAVTRDGRVLAAGGRSNIVHLWCLDSRELLRAVQMPPKVRTVRQLEFLPDSFDQGFSQILGVLSQDGIMRVINIQTCKLLFDIGSPDDGIASVAVSPDSRHIVAVMESGGLNIYSIQALTQDINKPPAPLVKVVNGADRTAKVRSGGVKSSARTSGRRGHPQGLRPPTISAPEDKENELPDELNKKRLQTLLKTFGEYPAKYRMFIWRSLLQLPENYAAFSSLTDKGQHAAFVTLHERYPIKSHRLQRGLQRVLSALAHWSAIFGETDYLPLLAFPFVKLFQNNPLVCFEVIATVIVNWCQHWFEYFPNPPLNVLSMVENVLAHHDKELLQHLVNCGVTSQVYAWPLLETFFSEALTRDEWLKLFDNIFSNHPAFLLMAVAAYVTCSRAPLLLCTQRQDFEYFFHHRNNLDIDTLIKETYRLMDSTPTEIHPCSMLDDFEPLTRGQYPIFNKYPTFIVEYHSQERNRIRQEEAEYLRERQELQELQAKAVQRRAEDEAWHAQQELLQEAEEQQRKVLQEEEARLTQQRVRLAAMKRELRVKELQLMDAARRRFLQHQQQQKKAELRRLDDEIQRKMFLRQQETEATVQEIEVRQMELEAQRRQFELKLAREQERVAHNLRAETNIHHRQAEVDESAFQQRLRAEPDLNLATRRGLEESLAEAGLQSQQAECLAEALERMDRANREQERRRQQLVALERQECASERRLIQTMQEAEGKKWEEVVERRAQMEEQRQAAHRRERLQKERLRGSWEDPPLGEECVNPETKSPCSTSSLMQTAADNISLNTPSLQEESLPFSLDRGRSDLDNRERKLMQDIRDLRLKLATRAKNAMSLSSTSVRTSQATAPSAGQEDFRQHSLAL
ncbi:TBC1 domain family member 31 [Arapaima gigas]